MDDQVKIRGYRIEIGEVVNQLIGCEQVVSATVVIDKPGSAQAALIAYAVAHHGWQDKQHSELSAVVMTQLRQRLPEYMLPVVVIWLDAIPLRPNGKIDKQSLPKPELFTHNDIKHATSELEQQLCQLWSEVLGKPPEQICIVRDFFSQGGNSLLVAKVLQRLESQWSISIGYEAFFRDSSIVSIAAAINTQQLANSVTSKSKKGTKCLLI